MVACVSAVLGDGLIGVVVVYSDLGPHFLLMVRVHISELLVSELEGREGHGEV